MKALAILGLVIGSTVYAQSSNANVVFCHADDRYTPACRAAIQRQPGFIALGCVGVIGENQPSLEEGNIGREYVTYGYQRRPRREYNRARGPAWVFTADSYDWACAYAAIQTPY